MIGSSFLSKWTQSSDSQVIMTGVNGVLFLNFFQQLEFFAIFGLEIHKDNVVGLFADLGLEG